MSSSIGLLSVFADVVILLALAAALASPRVSQLARAVIATFAFACAWLVTAAADAMRAPDWTIFEGAAVILVCIAAATVSLHLWASRPGRDGDGGGPRRHPDSPAPRGGDGEPSWWPEFEHELALYAAERAREKREPPALPAGYS